MLFQPSHVEAMWDTWMHFHEGTWYLFYLVTERGLGEAVGLATSRDGAHWNDQGVVLRQSKEALWLGTGAVWKSGSEFICNFSEWVGKDQIIRFAQSSDLVSWKRLEPQTDFPIDSRWYQSTPRRWSWLFAPRSMWLMYLALGTGAARRWDSIYAVPKDPRDGGEARDGGDRDGGGFWGFWTASPKGRPGFGFGESVDGLSWRALPPPEIDWGPLDPPKDVELAAVEPIQGRWYALVGSVKNRGMLVLQASRPHGPYRLQSKNPICLASDSLRLNTYYARFFASPDGLLVHHQSITRRLTRRLRPVTLFAPLKRAVVDTHGTLRLGWWEGNGVLTGAPISGATCSNVASSNGLVKSVSEVDQSRGVILTCTLSVPPDLGPDQAVGRFLIVGKRGRAISLTLDGALRLTLARADAVGVTRKILERVDREIELTETCFVRLLLRMDMAEIYVNDILMQCYSLSKHGAVSVWLQALGSALWSDLAVCHMA